MIDIITGIVFGTVIVIAYLIGFFQGRKLDKTQGNSEVK